MLSDSEFLRAYERNATHFILFSSAGVAYYGFDVTRPPFDDVRVRRAFALATDISVHWDPVIVTSARGGFVPPGMPAHQPAIGLPYDPEGARQLLAEAGYPGGRGFPEIVARMHPHPELGEAYRRIQELQWVEGLGIKMTWVSSSISEADSGHVAEPPHTFTSWWGVDYPDPDNVLRLGIPWQRTGWSNTKYTELVEEAKHMFDQGKRMHLYKQADLILIEEAVVVPIEYGAMACLVQPWLTRFPTAPVGSRMFWKDVIIEPH